MKKKIINFIPIIGIYTCLKYYFRPGKRTVIEFFDSEEMTLYHFFVSIFLLMTFSYLTN
jgi:hypothetical protein